MNILLIPALKILVWLPLFPSADQAGTHDNFILQVPSNMLRVGEPEVVHESFPVSECIAGSRVRGTGVLTANYDQQLTSSNAGANWLIDFQGTNQSRTRAMQKKVSVYQRGTLSFASQARVVYHFSGFHAEGYLTTGTLSTRTTSIRTPYRGIRRRIALKKVREQSGQHRRIAQRRGVRGIEKSFEEQVNESVAKLNRDYQEEVVDPLRRNGIYPSRSVVTSGDDSIRMGLYFGGEKPTSLVEPTLSQNDTDHLQLAVHQSAVNFTAHPLSGETRSLSEAVTELLPNEDPNAEAVDPLEVTFGEQPFRVAFGNDQVTVTLVGEGFSREGQDYGGMEISFTYEIRYEDSQQWLVRKEDPTVQHPMADDGSRPRLGLRDLSLRRVLLNTLKRDLPERIALREVRLPIPARIFEPLEAVHMTSDNGWLTVKAKRKEAEADEPAGPQLVQVAAQTQNP